MATTFQPQPLAAPLNDDAFKELKELLPHHEPRGGGLERDRHAPTKRYNRSRDLLKDAANRLTELTGELNDRAYARKAKHLKAKARREQSAEETPNPNAEEDDPAALAEADARYEAFQTQVEALTKRMDLSIRGLIDDVHWLTDYPETLKAVIEKAQDSAAEQRRNFERVSPTPARRRVKQRRILDGGDEEMEGEGGDDEDGEDDNEEESPRRPRRSTQAPPTLDPSETPHVQLAIALAEQVREWTSMSLTDRYAKDNHYKGFKKVLWDAENPGERAPPMPHESLWFAAEEGRSMTSFSSTQASRGNNSNNNSGRCARGTTDNTSFTEPDDDGDIQISSETARIKCPITFLPYVEPLTCKTCNHSYEKEAILQLLEESPVPLSGEQEEELNQIRSPQQRQARRNAMIAAQPKSVKCPEAGCNVDINGEDDLVENHALKRRLARLAAQQTQDKKNKKKNRGKGNSDTLLDVEADDGDDDKTEHDTDSEDDPYSENDARAVHQARTVKNEAAAPAPPPQRASAGLRDSMRDSVVPDSQAQPQAPTGTQASRPPRATQIVDLEDDD